MKNLLAALCLFVTGAGLAQEVITLPPIFTDHMVLPMDESIAVTGRGIIGPTSWHV